MRLIVPGANFSSKHIDQVEVPITWDSDAAVYRAAIPTAAAAFTYAKNRALNRFFKDLKSKGLWPNITNLYLPVLGRTEGGVNLKNPAQNINFPAAGAVVTYDANGALFLQGWSSGINATAANFHGGIYNTTGNAADTATRVGMSIHGGAMWIAARRGGLNGTGMYLDASYQARLPNHVASAGPIIASYVSATKFVGAAIDGEYTESIRTEAVPVVGSATVLLGGTVVGANNFALASPIGLITLGGALTQAQATDYAALQTTLMTALMA